MSSALLRTPTGLPGACAIHAEVGEPGAAAPDARPARILVIDDEVAHNAMLVDVLGSEGFDVETASSGEAGVARALRAPPDRIVCDVWMPGLDGYAVLAALRRDPGTAIVPVVFLTGSGDALSCRRGMEEGADDYLDKPVRGSALIRAVRARLARHAAVTRESRRRLEELRSSLARSLPHQFLTPLTAVMGLSSMLRDDVLQMDPTLVREVADGIYRGGESLQASIEKFLLLAELEIASRDADQVARMRGRRADERMIGDAARRTARRLGREGDLTIALEPGSIAIDGEHLAALVDEVVENAALFSRPGTPLAVRCRRGCGEVSIEVDDHGEGMLPQAESFATCRYLSRRHAKEPGINLGLAIVREVAGLYGGQVGFETRLGEGTTVRVTLPSEAAPRGAERSKAESAAGWRPPI